MNNSKSTHLYQQVCFRLLVVLFCLFSYLNLTIAQKCSDYQGCINHGLEFLQSMNAYDAIDCFDRAKFFALPFSEKWKNAKMLSEVSRDYQKEYFSVLPNANPLLIENDQQKVIQIYNDARKRFIESIDRKRVGLLLRPVDDWLMNLHEKAINTFNDKRIQIIKDSIQIGKTMLVKSPWEALKKFQQAENQMKPDEHKTYNIDALISEARFNGYELDGDSQQRIGNSEQALSSYFQASAIKPMDKGLLAKITRSKKDAYTYRIDAGRRFIEDKNYCEAATYIQKAQEFTENKIETDKIINEWYGTLFEKGRVYFSNKEYNSALSSYEQSRCFRSTTEVSNAINRTNAKIKLPEAIHLKNNGSAQSALDKVNDIVRNSSGVDDSDYRAAQEMKQDLDQYFSYVEQAKTALNNGQYDNATRAANEAKRYVPNGGEVAAVSQQTQDAIAAERAAAIAAAAQREKEAAEAKKKQEAEAVAARAKQVATPAPPKPSPPIVLTATVRLNVDMKFFNGYNRGQSKLYINGVDKGAYKDYIDIALKNNERYNIEIRNLNRPSSRSGPVTEGETSQAVSFVPRVTISFKGRDMVTSNGERLEAKLISIGQ